MRAVRKEEGSEKGTISRLSARTTRTRAGRPSVFYLGRKLVTVKVPFALKDVPLQPDRSGIVGDSFAGRVGFFASGR